LAKQRTIVARAFVTPQLKDGVIAPPPQLTGSFHDRLEFYRPPSWSHSRSQSECCDAQQISSGTIMLAVDVGWRERHVYRGICPPL
jgi:hypothetical protein